MWYTSIYAKYIYTMQTLPPPKFWVFFQEFSEAHAFSFSGLTDCSCLANTVLPVGPTLKAFAVIDTVGDTRYRSPRTGRLRNQEGGNTKTNDVLSVEKKMSTTSFVRHYFCCRQSVLAHFPWCSNQVFQSQSRAVWNLVSPTMVLDRAVFTVRFRLQYDNI